MTSDFMRADWPPSTENDYTPAEHTTQHCAEYVVSLPERKLGSWDDRYIRVVTGYGWQYWYSIFDKVKDFEPVFRTTTTHKYLVESQRWLTIKTIAEGSAT